jgi:hypothetical protein
MTTDQNQLNRGKIVFAENCAQCHSSIQPPAGIDPGSAAGAAWFRDAATKDPAFFTNNFLGDERPHAVDYIGTNATRAAATNAMKGHIWDNFSSETYKTRKQIGPIALLNPFDNSTFSRQIEGNGPGYYRPPSLISLWTSAPFLHNNSVGPLLAETTVKARVDAFNAGIRQMLLLDPRSNVIWRTTDKSYINIPLDYIPRLLRDVIKDTDPGSIDANGNLRLGPIPKGTPVNLISNLNLEGDPLVTGKAILSIVKALADIRIKNMNDQQATERLKLVVPDLIAANKWPDFVEDRGHMFGTKLPEPDKLALIELLKTF